MFKNIIVASDLIPKATFSARKSVQIAHQFNSNITVLNVHEEFMDKDGMEMLRVSVDDMQDKFRQIAIEAKNEIKSMFSKLHTDNIKIEVILRQGTPSKEIFNTRKRN